jgi:hypothetical protein
MKAEKLHEQSSVHHLRLTVAIRPVLEHVDGRHGRALRRLGGVRTVLVAALGTRCR